MKPTTADAWHCVTDPSPLPSIVGTKVVMVLDPDGGDAEPIVRCSTIVMSVVGVL